MLFSLADYRAIYSRLINFSPLYCGEVMTSPDDMVTPIVNVYQPHYVLENECFTIDRILHDNDGDSDPWDLLDVVIGGHHCSITDLSGVSFLHSGERDEIMREICSTYGIEEDDIVIPCYQYVPQLCGAVEY